MRENYLTGRGPTATCEYCGAVFHAETTGCPNPRCGANAGAQSYERWLAEGKDSRDVTGAEFVRGMRHGTGSTNL